MAGFVIPQGVMDGCKNGFAAVDAEGSGVMYIEDLKQGFREMGYRVTDDEVAVVLEASGVWGAQQATMIDFDDFVGLTLEYLKLKGVQQEKEQEALMAFMTLGGQPDGTGSIRADSLRDFVKRFELGIDIDALITEVDEDGNGALELKEFSDMLTEKPDASMLVGGFQLRGSASQDSTSPKRKGNPEKKPKANREAKPSVAEDDDEDDDTKIRRTRKRFEFMESLSKQYMNQKRWPQGASKSRGTGKGSASDHGMRRTSSADRDTNPATSQMSTASSYNRDRSSSMSTPQGQLQMRGAGAKSGRS
eukprot:CAMPEP_0177712690 /NCGR_PEP_ID=MMETSP0484_2-20121128/12536_1 /TAXON_ID=354590 /ORGANISM="Rhodomonas lens, Strain RHODO" /LENGTH=304 /DNA_ID=CAMNT_0019224521 /DNA_START=113 /DNA_END=1024 /DNA_ORIENTATION=-